jgi:peptide deformylase
MKTAMQELIDKIQYSIDVQSGVSLTETQVNTLKTVMLIAETLLEKEKEQIIDARNDGIVSNIKGYCISNEEYYNETYKQYGLDDESRQILNNL